jgi:hypothetical protein
MTPDRREVFNPRITQIKLFKKNLAQVSMIPYRPIPLSGKTNATYYMLSTNYQESPVAQAKVKP